MNIIKSRRLCVAKGSRRSVSFITKCHLYRIKRLAPTRNVVKFQFGDGGAESLAGVAKRGSENYGFVPPLYTVEPVLPQQRLTRKKREQDKAAVE